MTKISELKELPKVEGWMIDGNKEMKTYNSYEEAKIAMPEACIVKYKYDGKYLFTGMPTKEGTTLCNGSEFAEPADHCMTVEQFLKAGHKFVEGDIVSLGSRWNDTVTKSEVDSYNEPDEDDCLIYILRAAALEKPKRVKVEYVKCEFKQAWEAVKEHEENRNIFHCQDSDNLNDDYPICGYDIHIIGECARDGELYRRTETPIEWWEDALQFVKDNAENKITVCESEIYHGGELFIKASMNRDKWCDFARILLEQNED